jgi:tRNA pseudouridine13 synthase
VSAELEQAGGMPNYFGLQRFGSLRPITHVVGEAIVRGDVEGAVMAYLGRPQPGEPEQVFAARRQVEEERDFVKALTYFPKQMTFERVLLQHLAESPDDWVGALRKLPLNLATMFVYAQQSLLFNRVLSARLEQGLPLGEPVEGDLLVQVDAAGVPDPQRVVPVRADNLGKCRRQCGKGRAAPSAVVAGLDVPLASGKMGEIERDVLAKSGIEPVAYRIPHMPELASFGQRRAIVVRPGDLAVRHDDDASRFSFRLPKGSYATCLLREFMKSEALAY